jgi:hypothetical protein
MQFGSESVPTDIKKLAKMGGIRAIMATTINRIRSSEVISLSSIIYNNVAMWNKYIKNFQEENEDCFRGGQYYRTGKKK